MAEVTDCLAEREALRVSLAAATSTVERFQSAVAEKQAELLACRASVLRLQSEKGEMEDTLVEGKRRLTGCMEERDRLKWVEYAYYKGDVT